MQFTVRCCSPRICSCDIIMCTRESQWYACVYVYRRETKQKKDLKNINFCETNANECATRMKKKKKCVQLFPANSAVCYESHV